MEQVLFWIVPISSLLALLLAWHFYRQMMGESEGTPLMQKIASHVRKGAMSYLKQQYKIVGIVFLCLVILFSIMAYGFNLQNQWHRWHSLPEVSSRDFRDYGNEDGYSGFGPHCQCRPQFIEQRIACRFPKRSCDGSCCRRSWIARHLVLVSRS